MKVENFSSFNLTDTKAFFYFKPGQSKIQHFQICSKKLATSSEFSSQVICIESMYQQSIKPLNNLLIKL